MSSIAGMIGRREEHLDAECLLRMGRAMLLRGMDQHGMYWDRGIGLHHNRMIWTGHRADREPLTIHRGGNAYTILLDGEITNLSELCHCFERPGFGSAAEAVLECYIALGYACVNELQGAFAFAIYDQMRHELMLARDAEGRKPLYYTISDGVLAFASEIKGLSRFLGGMTVGREDLERLLISPVGQIGGEALHRRVCVLPPSHFAVYSGLGLATFSYRSEMSLPIWGEEMRWEALWVEKEAEQELRQLLISFDYPQFDPYMPLFLQHIRQNPSKRMVLSERASLFHDGYAHARADRLGMHYGKLVHCVENAEGDGQKNVNLRKMEKQLREILRPILGNPRSHLRKSVGADVVEEILSEKNAESRISHLGMLWQTEYWLSHYPISVIPNDS